MNIDDKIIIRSVFKITKASLTPCKIPGTNNYDPCVRKVDKNNNMILSREDKDSGKTFISEVDLIEIYDGKVFDLSIEEDLNKWNAIKYHKCIAKDRDERDEDGNLVIDGNQYKYGTASWYIEVPGRETSNKNKSRRLKIEAQNYIINDSPHDRLQKAKVLGKPTRHAHDSDIEDFLMSEAEKDPKKIINLYTSGDMALRLLLIELKDKHIIKFTDKMWMYGDIILGTNDESVISYMKQPANKRSVDLMKREAFPEYFMQKEIIKAEIEKNRSESKIESEPEPENETVEITVEKPKTKPKK
jgi:hypothetical protein